MSPDRGAIEHRENRSRTRFRPDPDSTSSRHFRRTTKHDPRHQRHRRLRFVYFSLASAWGFLAGSVAVFSVYGGQEAAIAQGGGLMARLALAGLVALVGGVVVSLAYREAVRRGS